MLGSALKGAQQHRLASQEKQYFYNLTQATQGVGRVANGMQRKRYLLYQKEPVKRLKRDPWQLGAARLLPQSPLR